MNFVERWDLFAHFSDDGDGETLIEAKIE